MELFNENILRGLGLLTKAILKAQMASPNFTHVYTALIAVINTKLPEIGNLLATRTMIMFKRSFHRNNKIVCMATTKMIAHLINQRVLGEFAGLQLLMILLMRVTLDSV
jgi:pre-mRNA-splicing factor CWC22